MAERHVVAMGGWDPADSSLAEFVLGLARGDRPRMCYVPTAAGDRDGSIATFFETFAPRAETSVLRLFGVPRAGVREFLLDQDVIWVSGGNTANMLAIWRLNGVDAALREAWEAGAVLAGWSAGTICWFDAGVTDSFGPDLAPLEGCLGFLRGSFCPPYDSEPGRRASYERLVSAGLPGGYAAEDGVGLRFVGTELAEAVSSRPDGRAFRVERSGDGVTETPLTVPTGDVV